MNQFTVARILFALPFLMFGVHHFMETDMMVASTGQSALLVYVSGAGLVLAAVAIAIEHKLAPLACRLLALELAIFIAVLHAPGLGGDNPMAIVSVLKDLALAGGALAIGDAIARRA